MEVSFFSFRILTVNHFVSDVWDEISLVYFKDLKAMSSLLLAVILEYER